MAASLVMTATYHPGHADYRSIAHVGLHAGAVMHQPDTDLFLPPHGG